MASGGTNWELVSDEASPARAKCHAELYQDAHQGDGQGPPPIVDENGNKVAYTAPSLWEEVYEAIEEAQKLVYITGWSVDTTKPLLRTTRKGGRPDETIGELLKRKADDGVHVLLHLWDEKASVSTFGVVINSGLMGIHDEETKCYFRNTKVKVQLSQRYGDTGQNHKLVFTHHQKTVICDAPLLQEDSLRGDDGVQEEARRGVFRRRRFGQRGARNQGKRASLRRLIGFVGGIDLTDGRFDTSKHSLFRTLAHEHREDFYNVNGISSPYGPRQPWHDNHALVEGPAAHDLLDNFVERWNRQASNRKKYLCPVGPENGIVGRDQDVGGYGLPEEEWTVQILRTIDKRSACLGNRTVIRSIQEAYVNAIRKAERFVYIENQYFLGSAKYWKKDSNVPCTNLVPFELAERVCRAVREKKQFNVYAVIPMHPEGDPASMAVQEIIRWENRSIQMIYLRVAEAINETYAGSPEHERPRPTDYVNFFCLGNRELPDGSEAAKVAASCPNANPFEKTLGKMRRFMIYVHSKVLIVDDAYVIIGSANINDRSMEGTRDTEICMSGWQPHFNEGSPAGPRGDVFKYRMSLWAEHLGESLPLFANPNTVECARHLRKLSVENWERYNAEETTELPFHLMVHPSVTAVDAEGHIHQTHKFFPDTKASTWGAKSGVPDILTT
eukprot:CAMPEP_0119123148 /NCGR_PEP_ID=MMETSP1310-20130426/3180_1 /TAXON_ID=464262 /ORGANISM="Genus nov. species nov., Strain RCC2339" /LENGTH=670 /DNA_ID=CAMNT_0007112905 /DNA_START=108 /DNA_END=2120 /DNA_ORIENTATION=+